MAPGLLMLPLSDVRQTSKARAKQSECSVARSQCKDSLNPGIPAISRACSKGRDVYPRAEGIFLELKRGCANANIDGDEMR